MGSISYASREVTCKVVYYGPAGSGKTTILRTIQAKAPRSDGKMISLSTDGKHTLFFDYFLLSVGKIRWFDVNFQLYTVPGAGHYGAIRKIVLRGADGIVFVADSAPEKLKENLNSLEDLVESLRLQDRDIADVPLVFQYNKRDLVDALPVWQLERDLNVWGKPSFESVSTRGEGVFPTLKSICRMSLNSLGEAWASNVSGGKFRVMIVGVEDNGARLAVAKRLSGYANISIDRAEALLDRVPLIIAKKVDVRKADHLKLRFRELGAIVSVEPVVTEKELVKGHTAPN